MKPTASRADRFWLSATSGVHLRSLLALFASLVLLALAGGCSVLPDKPVRAALYDFGPGAKEAQPEAPAASAVGERAQPAALQPPLAIEEITTPGGALDNMAVLYRLGYADAQQLRPYAMARWSMPPAQLVRQRLKERLGQSRPVFNAGEGVALERDRNGRRASAAEAPANPLLLRVELEEFNQVFDAPDSSAGLVR